LIAASIAAPVVPDLNFTTIVAVSAVGLSAVLADTVGDAGVLADADCSARGCWWGAATAAEGLPARVISAMRTVRTRRLGGRVG
jgi:hypothetical protein